MSSVQATDESNTARAGDAKLGSREPERAPPSVGTGPATGQDNEGRTLMFRKLSKKRLAAIGFVAALAITGVSVAYFTGGSGTVTGSGTVGSSTPLGVTTGTPDLVGQPHGALPGRHQQHPVDPVHRDQQRQRPPVDDDHHGGDAERPTATRRPRPAPTSRDASPAGSPPPSTRAIRPCPRTSRPGPRTSARST